jgi:hypothetical protein
MYYCILLLLLVSRYFHTTIHSEYIRLDTQIHICRFPIYNNSKDGRRAVCVRSLKGVTRILRSLFSLQLRTNLLNRDWRDRYYHISTLL